LRQPVAMKFAALLAKPCAGCERKNVPYICKIQNRSLTHPRRIAATFGGDQGIGKTEGI
jgi:hypothetical protein